MPAVKVSARSGTRLGLEPSVSGATVLPGPLPAGVPGGPGSDRMPEPGVSGPNSSNTLGARTSRDLVARKRIAGIGAQTPPTFQVVTLTVELGWKSLERL